MVNFRCCECGREFEEPKRTQEYHGDNFYEDWLCCPYCGGEYEDLNDLDDEYEDEEESEEDEDED